MLQHSLLKNGNKKAPKKRDPAWITLYNQGVLALNSAKRQENQEEEEEIDPECTFKPDFMNQEKIFESTNTPFQERMIQSIEHKKKKIDELIEGEKEREIEGCTFKPNLISQFSKQESETLNDKRGIDAFMRRQLLARQMKETKDSPPKKYSTNKPHRVTVPDPPKLGVSNLHKEISALERVFRYKSDLSQ